MGEKAKQSGCPFILFLCIQWIGHTIVSFRDSIHVERLRPINSAGTRQQKATDVMRGCVVKQMSSTLYDLCISFQWR